MSTRKSTVFYGLLFGFVCSVAGMVIASRLDLAPGSLAGTLSVPATNSAPISGPIDATTFRNIAHDAGPSVVSIIVTGSRPVTDITDFFNFQLPFGNGNGNGNGGGGRRGQGGGQGQQQQTPQEEPVEGAGSGFIIDKAGFILTNNHVIEDAKSIEIQLSTMAKDEPRLSAKVVGHDELTDTALLQLTEMPKEPLLEAKFGDSDQMAPGDWVMAIGNPFELSNTVTVGVVSAVGRDTEGSIAGRPQQMIQTDAAINPGNSGGPLLNLRGEVIGINTMILSNSTSEARAGNIGVGFAVPINTVRDLLPQLRRGKVTRGRIGVGMSESLTPEYAKNLGLPGPSGVEIKSVVAGGPAADAGIKIGDVVVEFNGQAVKNNNALVGMVTATSPGTTVPVKVYRDKKPITLNIKVAELDLNQDQTAQTVAPPRQGQERAAPTDTSIGAQLQELSSLTPRERQQVQLPAGRTGAVVMAVTPFSPAYAAGLATGDIILAVDGQPVRGADDAAKAFAALPAGATARVIVWHEHEENLVRIRKR